MKADSVIPNGGYSYFEHDADMGIVGRGATIEEAFERPPAMFAIMADLAQVPRPTVAIEFEEADAKLALVRWLNLLIRGHGRTT